MSYIVGFLTGAFFVLGALLLTAPKCPTEDSCAPDYVKVNIGPIHFGHWTGKEVTP
jgi:hypothetical protein